MPASHATLPAGQSASTSHTAGKHPPSMHSTGATFGMNAPHETASTSQIGTAVTQVVTQRSTPALGCVMQVRPGRHGAAALHGVPKHAVGTGAGSPVLPLPSPPPDFLLFDASEVELEPALVLVLASASVVQSPPSLEEPAAVVDVEASAVLVVPVPGMSPQAATRRRDRARRV